jgi:hypothetical protein
MVDAILATDPERIMKPNSGNMSDWGSAYGGYPPDYPSLNETHWKNHTVQRHYLPTNPTCTIWL